MTSEFIEFTISRQRQLLGSYRSVITDHDKIKCKCCKENASGRLSFAEVFHGRHLWRVTFQSRPKRSSSYSGQEWIFPRLGRSYMKTLKGEAGGSFKGLWGYCSQNAEWLEESSTSCNCRSSRARPHRAWWPGKNIVLYSKGNEN